MSETIPTNPTRNVKLHSGKAMGLATFLGGPLAGTYMLFENFKALEKPREAQVALISGVTFTLLLFSVLFALPEEISERIPNQILPAVYTMILWGFIEHYQGETLKLHKEHGNAFFSRWRAAGIGLISLCVILTGVFGYVITTSGNDVYDQYDSEMSVFFENEASSITIYQQINSRSREELLELIDAQGLPKWKENQQIIERVSQLEDLPETIVRQNEILKTYTELRLQGFQVLRKAVDEDSNQYNDQLQAIDLKINKQIGMMQDL